IPGQDRHEVLNRIAHEDPLPPRRIDPAIPKDLETIVLKAMARERDARYATALELAEDVSRFLEHLPVRARRPSPIDRAWKWMQRHRTLVTAGFATLLVSLVVMAVSVIWVRSEEQKAIDAADLASREERKAIAAAQDSRYESLAQTLLRIFWTPRHRGWSDEARKTIDEMTTIRDDDRLKSLATAARRGFDARVADSISPGGSSLLFDPAGTRLLIASLSNPN